VLVDDESEGKAETLAFLDRRIEGIMRFEKAKSRLFRADRRAFQRGAPAGPPALSRRIESVIA
jgi:hypothetical protein